MLNFFNPRMKCHVCGEWVWSAKPTNLSLPALQNAVRTRGLVHDAPHENATRGLLHSCIWLVSEGVAVGGGGSGDSTGTAQLEGRNA